MISGASYEREIINMKEPWEMEMPCICKCGAWFDLNDGYRTPYSTELICEDCHNEEASAYEYR